MIESSRYIQKLVAQFPAIGRVGKIAVAVSGGCDSVALLILLKHFCRMKNMDICLFHVDHSLRDDSREDMRWVEQFARQNEIQFYARVAKEEDKVDLKSAGTESWARNFRHRSFCSMMVESGASVIAIGHTADDQLETVLMRLFSGSSLQGMAGIRAIAEIATEKGLLKLWRPMISIHRIELERFLQSINQLWLEDSTNLTDDYLRNSVRHNLVPKVNEIFPRAGEKASLLLADLAGAQDFLTQVASEYLNQHLSDNRLTVKTQADAVRREVIRQWLIQLGFGREINRSIINRINDLWTNNSRGRRVDHRSYFFMRGQGTISFLAENL